MKEEKKETKVRMKKNSNFYYHSKRKSKWSLDKKRITRNNFSGSDKTSHTHTHTET